MEQLDAIINTISMSMGTAWASGINLYATLLVLGILQSTGNVTLPADLQVLANPLVMMAAGLMYAVEFFADKVPGVDTGWDALHTFVRIPAGALLAYGAVADVSPPAALAAAIVGGSLAAGSHATKSGSRVLINASPEPFTNWTASIGEDVLVIGGLWTALNYPWLFIVFLVLFILLMIWLLPKIWRGIKKILGTIARLFGAKQTSRHETAGPVSEFRDTPAPAADIEEKLEKLGQLLKKRIISQKEYNDKKKQLLDRM